MEINYTIAGGDGQTYGPVALPELQSWIRDGRVSAQMNVLRSDINAWHVASQYQELTFPAGAVMPPLPQAASRTGKPIFIAGQNPGLERKIKNGAGWFYWIAALSLINSISTLSGSDWSFFLGLGVAQVTSVLGVVLGGSIGKTVALTLSVFLCGLFAMFGVFANKRHNWAFITGLVLYLLDGLIFLFLADWASFGFHLFASFCIFVGFKANRELKKQTGT